MKYSNSGYMLLGYIIEKVTGIRYDEAVRKCIFNPLKMKNSGFDYAHLKSDSKAIGYYSDSGKDYNKVAPVGDSTVLYAAGSIYSTVGDLYKWHKALQKYKIFNKAMAVNAYTPPNFIIMDTVGLLIRYLANEFFLTAVASGVSEVTWPG